METTKTVAQEAYEMLKDIPSEIWIKNIYTDGERCCVMGHYTRLKSDDPNDFTYNNCLDWISPEGRRLRDLSSDFFNKKDIWADISDVNNGACDDFTVEIRELYPQPTPKERSLAFLQDMIKAGY